jgi:sodium/pantothenate symporter
MALAWSLFLLYVVVTLWLAWLGKRKTTSLESYAVGNRDMSPWIVGLALAASMTSTATFVINPGIVYAYGLSAILGYGVSAGLGLTLGIVILSKGFRKYGVAARALTVPQWIGVRYGDRRLTVFYALVNLLLLAMVVLICYAMAGLLLATLQLDAVVPGWGFETALGVVVGFVFAYVFFGGTYAHAYTNTVQGLIMLGVAVALIVSGIHFFEGGGIIARLRAVQPELGAVVHPGSILFRNLFEVFAVNFMVGFALAVQPHFMIKALYVKTDREVNHYLLVAVLCGVVFNLVMLCGLYARLDPSGFIPQFMESSRMGIDGVMPAYILETFSPAISILISIALLAAGMSTLDGILVALSAILANDLYLPLAERRSSLDPERRMAIAFKVGRNSLIAFGVLAFALSLAQHYRKDFSVALFAQEGVYALFAATFVPVLFGMFGRLLPRGVVVAASVGALAVHFSFRYAKLTLLTPADWTNPGLTATYGLLVSLAVVAGYFLYRAAGGGAAAIAPEDRA